MQTNLLKPKAINVEPIGGHREVVAGVTVGREEPVEVDQHRDVPLGHAVVQALGDEHVADQRAHLLRLQGGDRQAVDDDDAGDDDEDFTGLIDLLEGQGITLAVAVGL